MDADLVKLMAKKQAGVQRMRSRQRIVHKRIAKMLESRPEAIDQALQKVRQRMENTGDATREIYLEWYQILTTWSLGRIVDLLRDDSDRTEQLRACAPFDLVSP